MLGIEGYGSDSDNESDEKVSPPPFTRSVKLPPPKPSPSGPTKPSASTSTTGLALPPPNKRPLKRVTIALPEIPKDPHGNEDRTEPQPPAKKPRLGTGSGKSGLLGLLPAPKHETPVSRPSERVLGGGKGPGLQFRTSSSFPTRKPTVEDTDEADDWVPPRSLSPQNDTMGEVKEARIASTAFLPPSLIKGRANVSTEERHTPQRAASKNTPTVDFFGLSSSTLSSTQHDLPPPPPILSPANLPAVSSAPAVDSIVPPEPSPQDPYPGYYQLPSGAWVAHDPAYYKRFHEKWTKDYNDHVRALEKGIEKGFEGVETDGAREVDALKEMERAKAEIQDREERKALTAGTNATTAAPRMNVKGAALGGRARSRHQLSTLLTEAYTNREELEDRIAQGRKNRKEAGNKYGF